MGNYVSEQMLSFLQSIALGAALALVYDLLAALRGLGGRIWGGVLDVLFCLTCAISVFLFVMAGSGELRVFMVMGIVGGAVLFWCLLGSLLRPVWAFWLALALLPARLAAGSCVFPTLFFYFFYRRFHGAFEKMRRSGKKSLFFLAELVYNEIYIPTSEKCRRTGGRS